MPDDEPTEWIEVYLNPEHEGVEIDDPAPGAPVIVHYSRIVPQGVAFVGFMPEVMRRACAQLEHYMLVAIGLEDMSPLREERPREPRNLTDAWREDNPYGPELDRGQDSHTKTFEPVKGKASPSNARKTNMAKSAITHMLDEPEPEKLPDIVVELEVGEVTSMGIRGPSWSAAWFDEGALWPPTNR